ncbi:MAG: hypothetical protein Q4F67_13310, partial [Propionibacteriaceae bacterium]|nr:hypothetical protein [Propionibacteriaceae bacterium]
INGNDNETLSQSEELTKTVTATSKWDLSINGSLPFPEQTNQDFIKQNGIQSCTHRYGPGSGDTWTGQLTGNAGEQCYVGGFSVTLSQPNRALGGTPIKDGKFSYTVDLSPQSIWGQSVWDAVQRYNQENPGNEINLPGGFATQNFGGTDWVYQSANSHLLNNTVRGDGSVVSNSTTVENSVRSSGTTKLTNYQEQVTATYEVTGADTTAYTAPRYAGAPANYATWAQRGYVYTSRLFIEVPMDVITANFDFFDDLDTNPGDGQIDLPLFVSQPQSSLSYEVIPGMQLANTNTYTDRDGRDNNFRRVRARLTNTIAVRNQWQSPAPPEDNKDTPLEVEGPSTATSHSRYWPGNPGAYGPPGEAAIYKGDGVAVDGQPILSSLILEGQTWNGGGTLMCQSFDNSEVVIDPAVATATRAGGLQIQNIGPTQYPSYSDVDNGGATWVYGSMYQYVSPTQQAATGNAREQKGMMDRYGEFEVRYGVGQPTDRNCAEPITWYTAEQVAAGAVSWSSLNKVEVYLESNPGGNVQEFRSNVAIGMRVLDNDPGTLIETNVNHRQAWYPTRLDPSGVSVAGVRATVADDGWARLSAYDEVANNHQSSVDALMGDRLTHVDMMARIDKQVENHLGEDPRPYVTTDLWTPSDSRNVATQPADPSDISAEYQPQAAPPIYGPGSDFNYLLVPTLDANPMPAPGTMRRDVLVEDCLPVSARLLYQPGDPPPPGWAMYLQPDIAAGRQPYRKAPMQCAEGETYVAFYKPQADVTADLEAISLPIHILETATAGMRINQAQISLMSSAEALTSDADPSLFTQRADRARIEIQAPDGMRLAKATMNPVVFVDELLFASTPTVTWEIVARNINSGVEITDVDIIDYLPENGVNESVYEGGREFQGASVEAGTGIDLYYTKASLGGLDVLTWSDPAHETNGAGGSTVWCSSYDGSPDASTYPAGGDAAQCPTSADEVTGVRVVRPGVFENGGYLNVAVVMSAEQRRLPSTPANTEVRMRNDVVMRAKGIDVPLFSYATAVWFDRQVPPNPGSISGSVWDDYNRNGIWDEGEPPMPGVVVTATGIPTWCEEMADGSATECPEKTFTTVTREDGSYFGQLYPGRLIDPSDAIDGPRHPYKITFTTPEGYDPIVAGRSLAPETEVELNVGRQFITGIDAGYGKPPSLEIAKQVVDAATGAAVTTAIPGQRLTYKVTATNESAERPFAEDLMAYVVDDLAELLDDATLDATTLSADVGEPMLVDDHQVQWAGYLDAGASVNIEYTVTVNDPFTGDQEARNIAFVPLGDDDEPVVPPRDPDDPSVPATPTVPVTPPTACVAPLCAETTTEVTPTPSPSPSASVSPPASPSPS